MRIVLTNAGQQEINDDICNNTNSIKNKKYKSEQKKYNKKYFNQPNIKTGNINKYNNHKTINHNISHILTEENYINDIIINNNNNIFKKGNSSSKINLDNNVNNYKMIKISTFRGIPQEIKDLYLDNSKNINENEDNKIENRDDNIDNNIQNKIKNSSINNISLISNNNSNSNSLPLKDLLHIKNQKNINKNILMKKINQNEKNLINFLKSDRTIKPSLMEKINKANDNKLVKLDKICQIYFNNEKKSEILQQNIKDRIKFEYSNDSKYCRENLLNMGRNIQYCKNIFKSLSSRKGDYN